MAPTITATGDDAENGDTRFLIDMLVSCGKLDLNAGALATKYGLARKYNLYPKMRKILNKYGFTYDSSSKAVIKLNDDNNEGNSSAKTPKKTEKHKKTTPTPNGSERDHYVETPKKAAKRQTATPTPNSRKKVTPMPKSHKKATATLKSKKKRKDENQTTEDEQVEQDESAVSTDGFLATPQQEEQAIFADEFLTTPQPIKKSFGAEVASKEGPELDGPVMRMDLSPGFAEFPSSDDAEEGAYCA